MKKILIITLMLIAGLTNFSFAAYYPKDQAPVKSPVSFGVLTIQAPIQFVLAQFTDQKPVQKQAFLGENPYQSYFDQNPYANTEFKIDLDSFEMEYVLKIR